MKIRVIKDGKEESIEVDGKITKAPMKQNTNIFYVISGILGGLRCSLGLHSWCSHPSVESDVIQNEIIFRCRKCGVPIERDQSGRFRPMDGVKICTRCGLIKGLDRIRGVD